MVGEHPDVVGGQAHDDGVRLESKVAEPDSPSEEKLRLLASCSLSGRV